MLVDVVLNDSALYDSFLRDYPGRIFENQIHIDDSGEAPHSRQYWISRLNKEMALKFLAKNGSGDYAVYQSSKISAPLMVVISYPATWDN